MEDFHLIARLMEHENAAVKDDGHVRIEAEDNGCFAVYFSEAIVRAIEQLPTMSSPLPIEPLRSDHDDNPRLIPIRFQEIPMTTLVDLVLDTPAASPAKRLQQATAAVRLSFTWFGCRKTLTPAQKAEAADTFGAEGQFLSAGKKLVDTRHPAFRKVTAVRGKAVGFWRSLTLPYPESGIRLIRQDRIEEFDRELTSFRWELDAAAAELDDQYGELQAAARRRLGSLFNAADYPPSLRPWFKIDWDFPSVEPPDYLMDLHPRLYEQEKARIAARFEEAVGLAEQAFVQEFRELVGHLCERVNGTKVFRNSLVTNLSEFFERFRSLSVRSNAELDQLVAQAQNVVRGVAPQDLRDDGQLRQIVAEQLAPVQTALHAMLVDRPRRRILRGAT